MRERQVRRNECCQPILNKYTNFTSYSSLTIHSHAYTFIQANFQKLSFIILISPPSFPFILVTYELTLPTHPAPPLSLLEQSFQMEISQLVPGNLLLLSNTGTSTGDSQPGGKYF